MTSVTGALASVHVRLEVDGQAQGFLLRQCD